MQACFPGAIRNFPKEGPPPPTVSTQVPDPLSVAPDVAQTETRTHTGCPGPGTQQSREWWVWKNRAHNFAYRTGGG